MVLCHPQPQSTLSTRPNEHENGVSGISWIVIDFRAYLKDRQMKTMKLCSLAGDGNSHEVTRHELSSWDSVKEMQRNGD